MKSLAKNLATTEQYNSNTMGFWRAAADAE